MTTIEGAALRMVLFIVQLVFVNANALVYSLINLPSLLRKTLIKLIHYRRFFFEGLIYPALLFCCMLPTEISFQLNPEI
jgi:hypothetical protein